MPEHRNDDQAAGDGDSRGSLWSLIRNFFDPDARGQSRRAQLEEAIDELESEKAGEAQRSEDSDISPVEFAMLRNLLHFRDRDADDVAIPRSKIVAISASASWDEMVAAFSEHGHSRMPVYRETLDRVIGMMLVKDVFPYLAAATPRPADWTELMRQPLYVPQARSALDVLADMRAKRTHLAVVVDEYSGVDGIITIEDLVEEIVGEIEDEHDDAPEVLLVELPHGMWDAEAGVELTEVAEKIDERLAETEESVDTLGGLALLLAGQVPPVGSLLDHDSGWRIEIIEANDRQITRLRLHPPAAETDESVD